MTPRLMPGPGQRGSSDESLIPGRYFHLCASIPFFHDAFSLPKELGVQQSQRKSSGVGDHDGVSPERDLRGKLRKESWDFLPWLHRTLGGRNHQDPTAKVPPPQTTALPGP